MIFEQGKLLRVENVGVTGLVAEIDHLLSAADLFGGIGVGNRGFELIGAFFTDVAEAVEKTGGRSGFEGLFVAHDLEGGLVIFAVGENSGGIVECGDGVGFVFGARWAAVDLGDQIVEIREARIG